MGISGLLPALKSIQKTKQLSEFAGQTVAVDAYAWLHRAVHTCATELATGQPTTKYVRYVMERVRILRHNGVEPYIVFDGGPLPAKKDTEVSRKAKREDALARAKALQAQGKTLQARELFAKCADVTPEMAFQCIKALKAENVSYVVAPYEADAQMAYLERVGLVDAIITEDSDLLVFGCKNVLYKIDTVQRTVIHISRADFASVRHDGVILANWTDKQFREMAILSGCDYLASIPGIGLKTACMLLRKWKTVEQVVRAIALEGKKTVPRGYLENFKLAEKCFLHQRVYDPLTERLIHWNQVGDDWNATLDAHVGGDLEPSLAKQLAEGDVDPISLLPINDINPSHKPQTNTKGLEFVKVEKKDKGKGKAASGGILSFFGPNAVIPQIPKSPSSKGPVKRMAIGKASGKRTLADALDEDVLLKKHRSGGNTFSKFFSTSTPLAGPSRQPEEKENVPFEIPDSEDEDADSMVVNGRVNMQMQFEVEEIILAQEVTVDQEDGYISPTPSRSQDTDDLSSPIRPRRNSNNAKSRSLDDFDFGADVVSSPPSATPRRARSFNLQRDTPNVVCDLWKILGVEEIEPDSPPSGAQTTPTYTPPDSNWEEEEDLQDASEEAAAQEQARRQAIVAQGWKNRFAFTSLKRSNTNVTPAGRHRINRGHPYNPTLSRSAPVGNRRSLVFVDTLKKNSSSPAVRALSAQERLAKFRCQ